MTYKMIVLDLDDTLLRDDHTISPRTKEALMTAQEQRGKGCTCFWTSNVWYAQCSQRTSLRRIRQFHSIF